MTLNSFRMAVCKKIYRFGVLCSGFSLPLWQAEVITHLMNDGHEPVVLIIEDRPPSPPVSSREKWRRYTGKNALYNLFERFVMEVPGKSPVEMHETLRNAEVIRVVPEKRGSSHFFREEDIARIKMCAPDFLLRFGFNILRGAILEVAPLGIWSYHHDDEMEYRGGPPAFWEIFHGDAVTGVILQRITERLDGGIILKKGYFKTTDHSYSGNLDRVLHRAVAWPAQVCRQLKEGAMTFPEEPSPSRAPLYKRPGNGQMLRFLMLKARNKCAFHYEDLFEAERWNILLLKREQWGVTELSGTRMPLPTAPKHHFYADPFMVREGDTLHILFEDYDHQKGRGDIGYWAYDIHSGRIVRETIALRLDSHLSYPFMIAHEQRIYCLPETSQLGTVRLYELDRSSGNLIFRSVLLDFPGVDPTLFFHEGTWWLFCTHSEAANEELYLFYASTIDGYYAPHKGNPIKTDIRGARPAGKIFQKDGRIYRPGQVNPVTYGGGIAFFEITSLTPNSYKEELISAVVPGKERGFTKGIHTWCEEEGYLIADGKEYGVDRYHFRSRLKQKIGR
ncbi:MAG: hypothetical protein CSA95_05155 [Bacteroidetes bacterium]|nr:MAG: hypothetical protein CSA95_05155 [Bacteroidota bacterium]